MFECTICGLLSLNSISCPACGSQNLVDLTNLEDDDESLPTEIPGLDEAAQSWHEFEGSKFNNESKNGLSNGKNSKFGSLPFSFSGQSNITISRLPFGIGSHSDGIPFDQQPIVHPQSKKFDEVNSLNDSQNYTTVREANELISVNPKTDTSPTLETREIIDTIKQPLPEVTILKDDVVRLEAITEDVDKYEPIFEGLSTEFELPDSSVNLGIPEEWIIPASEADMAEIYSKQEQVIEVIHHDEEDVVVYQHESTLVNETMSKKLGSNIVSKLSLELHPARAMDVDLSNNPECREDLDAGFFAIAEGSWSEAALRFQSIASRMPGNCAVFNNYGLALLQRAIEMAHSDDESTQLLASSQFESSILALRESAKSNPDESLVLLNLAHALLVSGRSEKALKIIQVHNTKNPLSVEGANLEAATLVSMGQSTNAKTKLTEFQGDVIVDENLARLL